MSGSDGGGSQEEQRQDVQLVSCSIRPKKPSVKYAGTELS
jgi:hypothetical protein